MQNSKIKKIIDFKNVKSFFSKISKKKKIVHCHGVFDLVHPGHFRHFDFCKSKGDILVVSLTSDKFIEKGLYRPLIPENLRAKNLAALELVDYVIIDKKKYPYALIKNIKPNFFAKGLEYSSLKNPLTLEEKRNVEKIGGKMLFSPGDTVFSSTKLINDLLPSFTYEKLKLYLDSTKINFNDLKTSITSLKDIKVHIIGDLIVDTISNCNVVGGLHKTPTLSVAINNSKNYVGGAGVVAKHFRSFSKNVTLTTILGKDNLGKLALQDLKKHSINVNYVIEEDRPTTNKNSFYADKYKLLKVDRVSNENINEKTQNYIKDRIKAIKADIVVFSDFRHGIFNKNSIPVFIKNINKRSFKVADSQVASRWGNILDFKNFDLITPTEKEARFSIREQDLPIRPLADKLLKQNKSNNIILKLGEKGLISLNKGRKDYISLDPITDNIIDTNGSGDALLAFASAILFKTNSLILSSIIGIIAASCKCENEGNKPVSITEMFVKIDSIKKVLNL
jgi:rfaE bifunctional protein kinase chain/domain/rfaE bifunctional protein nucleotidyltransferase chain/domain